MHAVPFTLLLAASSSVAQIGFSSVGVAAPSPSPAALSPTPQATEAAPSSEPAAPSAESPAPSAKPSAPSAKPSVAPPAASASPSGQRSPAALPRDRAANLIGGVWQCETLAGNTGTHTYAENEDDGSIDVSIELRAGYRTFHIRESYRYDDGRKLWTARTADGAYVGTAPPWSGYKWTFDGTAQERGERRAVRMVYFDLADQAFRRDFQAKQDGAWKTYSAETCRRPSN